MRNFLFFVSIFWSVSTTLLAETTGCNVNQISRAEVAPVTIACTAGNLATLINAGATPIATITDLVVTGSINQKDLLTIKSDMSAVTNIDLSATTVEGCTNGGVTYAANEIPENMFYLKTTLRSIKLPENLTSIGGSSFKECANLISVTMPTSILTIGDNAFRKCTSLATIVLPETLTSIGILCFTGCTGLTSVSIPASIKKTSSNLFNGCTGLTDIVIPEGITAIDGHSFFSCSSLKSVSLPSSLTTISSLAFAYNGQLEKIVCFSPTPPAISDDTFVNLKAACQIYVPVGSVSAYKAAPNWNRYTNIIEYTPTSEASVIANTKLIFNENTIAVSSDKVMTQVDILNFDGKLLARQYCNNSSCTIELKGESKVLAKIIYQDGTSQTHKLMVHK